MRKIVRKLWSSLTQEYGPAPPKELESFIAYLRKEASEIPAYPGDPIEIEIEAYTKYDRQFARINFFYYRQEDDEEMYKRQEWERVQEKRNH